MALSEAEIARYARQLLLPAMGEEGQERLRAARVRVAGGGPASGPALLYLVAAGWAPSPSTTPTRSGPATAPDGSSPLATWGAAAPRRRPRRPAPRAASSAPT